MRKQTTSLLNSLQNGSMWLGCALLVFVLSACLAVFQPAQEAKASGPTLLAANIETPMATRIWLVFDDLARIGTYLVPSADFAVVGSVQGQFNVSTVARYDSFLVVELASPIQLGQVVTITYVPSTDVPVNRANEPLAGFSTSVSFFDSSAPSQNAPNEGSSNQPTSSIPTTTPTSDGSANPTPSVSQTSTREVFRTCSSLNAKYIGGIAKSFGSRNKGAGMTYIPRVNSTLYLLNVKLDRDRDGIACER